MPDKRKQAYELAEHATDMELASMASVVLALPHVHESSTLYHECCDLLIDICNHNNKHIADTAKGIMQRLHDAYNNNTNK